MLSSVGSGGQPSVARARAVKYMANRPAKNINSLESQMMLPTLTMFGRVRECTREVSKVLLATGAVVTRPSWHRFPGRHDLECSTGEEVVAAVDRGGVDVCLLDGEAQPTGGLALSRQLKAEIADCPDI